MFNNIIKFIFIYKNFLNLKKKYLNRKQMFRIYEF